MAMPTPLAKPCPSGPGGGFDAGGHVPLGMPGRFAAPLAETLDLVQRQIVAGQVQQAVEQHRTVAGRKHEAVAIEPAGIAPDCA